MHAAPSPVNCSAGTRWDYKDGGTVDAPSARESAARVWHKLLQNRRGAKPESQPASFGSELQLPDVLSHDPTISSPSCVEIMMSAADFSVTPEIYWASSCMPNARRRMGDSAEEPEEQPHQQQRDEIHPSRHRDQRDAEKQAFECPLSDPRERKCRSRSLKHLGLLFDSLILIGRFVRRRCDRT